MTSASTNLHVVVACTDRKRHPFGAPIRLGDVAGGTLTDRCREWWQLLSRAPAALPAHKLYTGEQWAIARSLPDIARERGFAPSLWVASAGYGLVPADFPLASYSATFSPDYPDSIVAGCEVRAEAASSWWTELACRSLPESSSPRTLRALAETSAEGTAMLVVASPAYLEALERDLVDVISLGQARTRLVLVTSAPGPADQALHPYWVRTAAPLRLMLGGTLFSLHMRVACRLVQEISPTDFNASHARAHVQQLLARSPNASTPRRDRKDDQHVRAFIRKALQRNVAATYTRLLREYRAAGHACEQSRFRELFRSEANKL